MSILTFGEILLRIQGQGSSLWEDPERSVRIYPGGSEVNVASALAKLGHPVEYLTALPDNAMAIELRQLLENIGINCSKSVQLGDRIGTYYLLSANGLSKGEVIYDRRYSSFTQLKIDHLDMDSLFEGVTWFHWSTITPALSMELADLLAVLLQEAHNRGIYISVDLNYRNKLWQYGKSPLEVVPQLVSYCHVIMGNVWAAEKMLGYKFQKGLDRQSAKDSLFSEASNCAAMIFEQFPNAEHIAMTYRFMDNPKHNLFFGTYHTKQSNFISASYESHQIVDRIGSGDAFMAGLIHAIVSQMSEQEIVDTATKQGYNKLFIEGDFDLKPKHQNGK